MRVHCHNSTIALENWFKTPTSLANTIKATLSAGQSIQLIALGGGTTAGAMNGGLYRQSQLAAYPNLVAKQLGMNDFVTPVFSKDEENGTGYTSTHKITNNLAVIRDLKDGSPPTFTSFEGVIHNYAAPFLDHATINGSTWDNWMISKVTNGLNGLSWQPSLPYVRRFASHTIPLLQQVKDQKVYNFFILEDMNEVFFNALRVQHRRKLGMGDFVSDILSGYPQSLFTIQQLTENKQKGVLFTVPNFHDLGYAKQYHQLSQEEIATYSAAVALANKHIRNWASTYNLALVDLEKIYQQIHSGNYQTMDGLKVVSTENFFSSDGIYPSVLGHAIIANEVLAAINATYQVQVPLISIKDYLMTIGYK